MLIACVCCCIAMAAASAQTATTITTFDGSDGWQPFAGLVQGLDGDLYGTTTYGGAYGVGTIYKITPEGALTVVYSFCIQTSCAQGVYPYSVLLLASDGSFYGTTQKGGTHGGGTVFKFSPSAGTLSTLYNFCGQTDCADGKYPRVLVQGSNGNLYGTTLQGGTNCISQGGCGTVFEITSAGTMSTLHSFCAVANCTDGIEPFGLMQATDGNLYGTTEFGGNYCFLSPAGCGTFFEMTTAGKLTTLYTFCQEPNCKDGAEPQGSLIQSANGNFYGTTFEGGNYILPNGFSTGTAFEITPEGVLRPVYDFCPDNSCSAGSDPVAGLVLGTDGNFYGTTYEPGAVVQITPKGQATYYPLGYYTNAGVVQATNGSFYGTTFSGGNGYGTVYSLSLGLAPFVETLPSSGQVGAQVIILGSDLTGATSVTFNGTAATFTVVSSTEITTTVPAGATAGTVEVITPGGTLESNAAFRVTK
jgi:uncharacterized repeat protein (TIGR03803 family)